MILNYFLWIVKPRNIFIFQIIFVAVFLLVMRVSPDLSVSSVLEQNIRIIAPSIYQEHFKNSVAINGNEVVGFVNHHSVPSGQNFRITLSTAEKDQTAEGKIEISRIGFYNKSDRKQVYLSETISVLKQKTSVSSFIVGAAWKPLANDVSTDGWRSGYYAIDFVKNDGRRIRDVAFIVVTNPDQKGDILIKLSTNTYQAYNQWGGGSLYTTKMLPGTDHADVVSFDRPTQTQFYKWEYYYILWLEKLAEEKGLKIDYATNFDFYETPDIADNYTILMSLGHDEYWSLEEFDAYYDRIFVQGKNTLFLSANTAFWRVRYSDLHETGKGRQLICYKNQFWQEGNPEKMVFDPIANSKGKEHKLTGLFRGRVGYPETMLMGVGYESNFSNKTSRVGYKVKTVLPWMFKGTQLKKGDHVADVIGYEWDNTSLRHMDIPVWSEEKSHIPFLDREKLQVIFEGDVVDKYGDKGLAEAVYFETQAGARVFSAGTIRWAWGVGKPDFIEKDFQVINENLILKFLE